MHKLHKSDHTVSVLKKNCKHLASRTSTVSKQTKASAFHMTVWCGRGRWTRAVVVEASSRPPPVENSLLGWY